MKEKLLIQFQEQYIKYLEKLIGKSLTPKQLSKLQKHFNEQLEMIRE